MTYSQFLIRLFSLSLILAIIFSFLTSFPIMKGIEVFGWYNILFFLILTSTSYFILSKGISQKSNHNFINSIYVGMMVKFLLCIMMVVGYAFLVKSANKYFIVPFFLFYIIYNFFETYCLIKLTKS